MKARAFSGTGGSSWQAAVLAVLVLSVLAFSGSLTGEFVWDDFNLVNGSAIGGGESLLHCFSKPFLHNFFRPLVSVSFFFERRLWGDNPLGYHVTNLLLHALGTAAMIGMVREAFQSRRVALIGGLAFAIHPVHVGAVAWIGGRTDALVCLWAILFGWCVIRAARRPAGERAWPLAGALLFFNLALYTKEQSVALLPLAPLAFRCWQPAGDERGGRPALTAVLLFGASAALFLMLGSRLGLPRPNAVEYTFGEWFAQVGRTITHYAGLLLVPEPRGMHTLGLREWEKAGAWPVAAGWLVAGCAVFLLVRWRRVQSTAAWFLGWAVLALLPVSNLIPLPFLLAAPYRAALSQMGIAAVLGWAVAQVLWPEGRERSWRRDWAFPALALVGVWWAVLGNWGSEQWLSEVQVFETFARYDPDNIAAANVLAWRYGSLGRDQEAARTYEKMLTLLFGGTAWRDGAAAARMLRDDRATRRRADQNDGRRGDPSLWIASLYGGAGHGRLRSGDPAAARRLYEEGLKVHPNEAEVNSGMGYLASERGDWEEVVRRMRIALWQNPGHIYAARYLGWALEKGGRWEEALQARRYWLGLEPDSEDAKIALRSLEERLSP
jgi:tetratricopeptide (TPR) repeat protein